ncbi:MAG: hypothetical protein FWF25_07130 [Propionibacteriaceae bacterium]|nr:hypothetical protein [Propionibacteriaceae bacterium]
MTTSPTMPGQEDPGQPTALKKKPGIAGFIIGPILIVVGIVLFPVVILGGVLGATSGVSSQPSYPSDQDPVQVTLTGGQETGFWFSANGYGACAVADPSGNLVDLTILDDSQHQVADHFVLVETFVPATDGQYTVACQSTNTPFQFKVAPTVDMAKTGSGIAIGVTIAWILIAGGIALLIVTGVRRSRWTRKNRSLAASAGYNGSANFGPAGGQQAYQPAGYPSGTPQPGTVQPGYGPGPSVPPQTSSFAPPPAGPGAPTDPSASYPSPSYSGSAQPASGVAPVQQPGQGSSYLGSADQPPASPGSGGQAPSYPPPSSPGPGGQPS